MAEDNQPVQQAAQPQVQLAAQPHFNPVQVPLPDRFNFTSPDTWPAWVRRFGRFRIASGLSNRPANDQISTMVYAMGDQAEDVVNTLHVPDDASYEQLKQTLDAYFGVRRNLVIEKAKLNRRTQHPGECVDVFVQDLFRLAEHCDYGVLREQLIRDRIVVGVIDNALSDRLQAQADFTLDQSVQLSRQAEARKLQRNVVRGGDTKFNPTAVEFVKPGQRSTGKHSAATTKYHAGKCKWCGQQQHDRKVCPARQSICHNCQKAGHFSCVCRSSPAIKPRGKSHSVGDVFLGEIDDQGNCWTCDITVNGHPSRFKLDTGAGVAEQLSTRQIPNQAQGTGRYTTSSDRSLESNHALPKQGNRGHGVRSQKPTNVPPEQGCMCISEDEISGSRSLATPKFGAEFPKLFTGLGKLNTDYRITLQPGAIPFCHTTARKVPHPLLKKELGSMLKQGVISPVKELTKLNQVVRREMMSVDESLAKLGKSKIFTKLDANSTF